MSESKKANYIKLYTTKKEILNELLEKLKLKLKINYFRLSNKKKTLNLRKGPCGRGYAVFVKKQLKIYKALVFFDDLKKLNAIQKYINVPELYAETVLN